MTIIVLAQYYMPFTYISSHHVLYCGVPKGSVQGALYFTLFMMDIGNIIRLHGINHLSYEDDNQDYASFSHHMPQSYGTEC